MEARNARFTRIQARGKRHQARLAHLGHLGPLTRADTGAQQPDAIRARGAHGARTVPELPSPCPSVPSKPQASQAREDKFDFNPSHVCFVPSIPSAQARGDVFCLHQAFQARKREKKILTSGSGGHSCHSCQGGGRRLPLPPKLPKLMTPGTGACQHCRPPKFPTTGWLVRVTPLMVGGGGAESKLR